MLTKFFRGIWILLRFLAGFFIGMVACGFLLLGYLYLKVPVLVRGWPWSHKSFEERVMDSYPIGMDTDAFVNDIQDLGFRINEERASAEYKLDGFPCTTYYLLNWDHDENGKLSGIKTSAMNDCL